MNTSTPVPPPEFKQICGVGAKLYALDDKGRVWRYVASGTNRKGNPFFAFWTRITDYRALSSIDRTSPTQPSAIDKT